MTVPTPLTKENFKMLRPDCYAAIHPGPPKKPWAKCEDVWLAAQWAILQREIVSEKIRKEYPESEPSEYDKGLLDGLYFMQEYMEEAFGACRPDAEKKQ